MDEFTKEVLSEWAHGYRAAAENDRHRKIIAWHEANGCECTLTQARRLIRQTVELVTVVFVHRFMNGWAPKEQQAFLRRQVYDPAKAAGRYRLVLENCASRWPGVSVEELREVDLSDLYDGAGFRHLDIWRVDGKPLSSRERTKLKKQVDSDFGYDYAAPGEEVRLQIDEDSSLHVMPYTKPEPDAETEKRKSP